MKYYKNNSGIALLLTIVFVTAMITVMIALIATFLPRIKTSFDVKNSVNALYAADTGIEYCLYVRKAILTGSRLYWKFNEGNGNKVYDSTTSSNDGNIFGNRIWTIGFSGNALQFDGAGDYILHENGSTGRPTSLANNPLSFTAWIKTLSTEGLIMQQGSTDAGMMLAIRGGRAEFTYRWSASSLTTLTGTTFVNDNNWHLLVGTIDGSGNMRLVVDNQTQGTGLATLSTTEPTYGFLVGSAVAISGGVINPTADFNGTIDDVRIYAKDLTPDIIEIIYNGFTLPVFQNDSEFTLNPPDCTTEPLISVGSSGTFRGVNRAFEISF
ncbi:MAG: hypothetical protein COV29_04020 [Candidatus Yanofskybacteria bacterium CG10_big_fil_rev_8_21_14_0_10_36_16]|uniref:Laminin G domain-containing protein n=1 Tax=Candidatus Yanofskybacteria bacterium CG10_big_fil_rev_8_21_14_0_10_36_16 TaxID=1975096 RepID=A0A2J0Q6Q8_9BACT|nr:MAG: hypothetical protein COV29_04020 [Candidatus Yanofskybacteria bacterium CG10_big_fil_rev_8_21_14_0_10_36_16]